MIRGGEITAMTKVVILGAGAAPGVPSLCCGWGNCNPENKKNRRIRTSTYYEFPNSQILIDTSPDLRQQLINNQINYLDAVLYTHAHADHLHGIDDLREINRINQDSLDIYGCPITMEYIQQRFDYLLAEPGRKGDCILRASLIPHQITPNETFYIKETKITPIKLLGHNMPTTGYIFNDGEIVHIADFRAIDDKGLEQIKQRPKLLIMPLTTPEEKRFHAGLETILQYIEKINPEKTILNHMASECDYDEINALTPKNVYPAYDNMIIELKE